VLLCWLVGEKGGSVPQWFRSFGSSFAWMSGFGSSFQLQTIAKDIRSSLNADATSASNTIDDTTQHRRLLATDTSTNDDDNNIDNSMQKFAKALGIIYFPSLSLIHFILSMIHSLTHATHCFHDW
jgi:hypothetical protein